VVRGWCGDGGREARKLLADVKERRDRERALFSGVCNKSGFVQPEEEAAAAAARDEAARRAKPKSALEQRFDAYAEYEKRRSLGFKWEHVGSGKPATGKEVTNAALARELECRSKEKPEEFSWVELDQMGVPKDLAPDSFIMVGKRCFQPRGRDWFADEQCKSAPAAETPQLESKA